MKLWHSFIKELKLSSKSYYFYVEIFMALAILLVLLFVVPKDFSAETEEYIYLDLPEAMADAYKDSLVTEYGFNVEEVKLESDNGNLEAELYEMDDRKLYFLDSRESAEYLAREEEKFSAVVYLNENNQLRYRYYLQGYEADRLKNLYLLLNNDSLTSEQLIEGNERVEVRAIESSREILSDRDSLLPVFLTFNGSLMGLFMIASYIFLDRQEGIVQAYAVTPSPIWNYLLSKTGVIIFTSIIFSLIILLPTVKLQPNYGLLLIFLIASGFFATSLGLVITSYYRDIMQSFGALYIIILALLFPNIAYFVPSWNPFWIRYIPTFHMIESFKEILLENGDYGYVLLSSAGFLAVGLILFSFANYRFKKTLIS
jgi:ABC-2 type transport system permease protein